MYFRYVLILWILCWTTCARLEEGEQFTKKVEAPAFVSELYGTSTQSVTVEHTESGHISWMGFIQSNDYKYFKITKVMSGGQVVVADGITVDETTYTASSNAIIEDISVGESAVESSDDAVGDISVSSESDLKITVQYAPLVAIESEDVPHEAYLIVYYDEPDVGALRIKLEGYTQGVKEDKCTQAISTFEPIVYQYKDDKFDLYFCCPQVAANDQSNTDGVHGDSTNLASIDMTGQSFTFYKADDETVCLLSEPPSIADFILPVPKGLAPITSMDISLVEGSYAECDLDADGNIYCPGNIQLDSLVTMSGLTLTNQTLAAEDLVTTACPDFGTISGSGVLGDGNELKIIVYGTVLSDPNTEEFNIVDALVVSEITLTP